MKHALFLLRQTVFQTGPTTGRSRSCGILLLAGFLCFCTVAAAVDDDLPQRKFIWTVQGNVYHGSIVGRTKVDGISGASPNTHGATVGVEYNLKGHFLQMMLTYGRTKQTIEYNLTEQGIAGKREIRLHLFDLPLMYNFHFFRKPAYNRDNPRLILSPGIFFSFLLNKTVNDSGSLESLETSKYSPWASGIFLRAAWYPYPFKAVQPGIFLEFYRSFLPKPVYDDPYFRENGISGQLGILNTGISLRF